MSDEKPSHPYRDPIAIVRHAEERSAIWSEALNTVRADLDEFASGLDAVLRKAPRDTLLELTAALRRLRRRNADARNAITIARGIGTAFLSTGAIGSVVAALFRQPYWWALLPCFPVLLLVVVRVWRAILALDEVIASLDRLLARIERTIDSGRPDRPLDDWKADNEKLRVHLDEVEREQARQRDEVRQLVADAQQLNTEARQLLGAKVRVESGSSRQDSEQMLSSAEEAVASHRRKPSP